MAFLGAIRPDEPRLLVSSAQGSCGKNEVIRVRMNAFCFQVKNRITFLEGFV
jgi:hypothetical protein